MERLGHLTMRLGIITVGFVPRNEFRGSQVPIVQGTTRSIAFPLFRPLDDGFFSASEFIPW